MSGISDQYVVTRDGHADALATAAVWLQHPLAQRYAARCLTARTHESGNAVYTAADVLGERLLRCANALVAFSRGHLKCNLSPHLSQQEREDGLTRLMCRAILAPPYLWADEVVDAIADTDVPEHVFTRSALGGVGAMWWTYETARNIGTEDEPVDVDCLLLVDYGESLGEWMIGGVGDEPFVEGRLFKYDTLVHATSLHDPPTGEPAGTSAALSFLNSPFIPRDTRRLLRQERRSVQRSGAPDVGEIATFIVLRRPRSDGEIGSDIADRRYVHQWIVSGHFRNQWYPSEEAHRLIWIAPHIKGPDGAPMIEHAFKVAR